MRNFQPNIYAVEPVFMQSFLETFVDIDTAKIEGRLATLHVSNGQRESRLTFDQILNGDRESIISRDGNVVTVAIKGFLSPEGPSIIEVLFGIDGTAYVDIQNAVAEAAADETVESIVLAVDSPGGTVTGADETFQAIKVANEIKPVHAINMGIMASAAYYLSAAAGTISSSSPQNETGSIGVIIAGFDFSEMAKEEGIKRIVIVSENAPHKDQSLWAGAGIEALQARVDAAERIFIQRVSEGRGVPIEIVQKTFGRGSVLVAKDPQEAAPDALSVGMIDSVVGIEGMPIAAVNNVNPVSTPTPATKAGKTKEVKTMSKLTDFMAENPEAAAEVETLKTNAKAEGHTAGKAEGISDAEAEAKKRADAAAPFLAADSTYGASIRGLAAKVTTGEASVDSLVSAVAAVDEMKETTAAAAAAGEAGEETPPGGGSEGAQPEANGSVKTEEQFQAQLATKRKAAGLGDQEGA